MIDPDRIVDAWRSLDSEMARTFVAIAEAADTEHRADVVGALARGLPGQYADTAELVQVTAEALTGTAYDGFAGAQIIENEADTVDPLDFLAETCDGSDNCPADTHAHIGGCYRSKRVPDADR